MLSYLFTILRYHKCIMFPLQYHWIYMLSCIISKVWRNSNVVFTTFSVYYKWVNVRAISILDADQSNPWTGQERSSFADTNLYSWDQYFYPNTSHLHGVIAGNGTGIVWKGTRKSHLQSLTPSPIPNLRPQYYYPFSYSTNYNCTIVRRNPILITFMTTLRTGENDFSIYTLHNQYNI